eukprot:g612.t1
MSKPLLSPSESLVVGCIGGTLEVMIQMPVITRKFCVQEGRKLPATFGGYYTGIGIQAGSVAPLTALQMFVNSIFLNALVWTKGGDETMKLTDGERILCSMGAGIVSGPIYSYVDLMLIHQQKLSLGLLSTSNHIAGNYGYSRLLRGTGGTCFREALYTAGYLGFAPFFKKKLQNAHPYFTKPENDLTANILGSCGAGFVAATLTQPVDTAKTIMQADIEGKTFTNCRTVMRNLINDQGIASCYKGFAWRTMRICGAFSIINLCRDQAQNLKMRGVF